MAIQARTAIRRSWRNALVVCLGLVISGCSTSRQPDAIIIREPVIEDTSIQDGIDEARQTVDEQTKQGRGEVKPWNERYQGKNPNKPYQGPSIEQQNRQRSF